MKQRHKHADVIIAWAEGKDVQIWDSTQKEWCDVIESANWSDDCKYRIKPPANKYRVALFKRDSEYYTLAVNNQAYADIIESRKELIRWLTDWIEYEE